MLVVKVEKQGFVLKCKPLRNPELTQVSRSGRGNVTEFSMKSRKRLIELFAAMDVEKMKFARERVKFITVTYQDVVTNGAIVKLHLKRFMERLLYANPDMWAVWKLEYQQRGSLHLHFIVGNMPYVDKDEIKAMWNECSDQSGFTMTRIEAITSLRGVLRYASKYMTKTVAVADCIYLSAISSENDESQAPGRFWGVYGRANLPMSEKHEGIFAMSEQQYMRFIEMCNNPYANDEQGFTLFQENTQELFEYLRTQSAQDIYALRYAEHWMNYRHDKYVALTRDMNGRFDWSIGIE